MLEARNLTPGDAFAFEKEGVGGEVFSVIVLKASFDLTPGVLRPAKEPLGIVLVDQYFGDPQTTSLRLEGDIVIRRPATDLWITGEAVAPGGRPQSEWVAALAVGPLAHQFRLFGPRTWAHDAADGWRLASPEPVSRVALRYEHAFGGTQLDSSGEPVAYPQNPLGVGFYDLDTLDTAKTYPAPAILNANDSYTRIDARLEPAPLGPLSRWWEPRYRWAGTYDEAWERSWREKPGAYPYLPHDFDYRFYNAAHPALVASSHLRGDEPLSLRGFGDGVDTTSRLPGWRYVAVLLGGDDAGRVEEMKLDTVHVDLARRQAHLVWRLTLPASLDASSALLRPAFEE